MTLTPISKVILDLQDRPGWEGVKDWGAIVRAWQHSVSPAIADRTQPRSLSRGILTIATKSATLAHQLTLGRQALCSQLNTHLITPIGDLRFIPIGYDSRSPIGAAELTTTSIDSGDIVICPQCQCRARAGELQRWDMCQFCAIDLGLLGGNSERIARSIHR
jgi:predicted nucleic acid-binding Zn ribbon protein